MRNIDRELDKASRLGSTRKRKPSKAERRARVAAANAARRKSTACPPGTSDKESDKGKENIEQLAAQITELERDVENLEKEAEYWKGEATALRLELKDQKMTEKQKEKVEEKKERLAKKEMEDLQGELERETKRRKLEFFRCIQFSPNPQVVPTPQDGNTSANATNSSSSYLLKLQWTRGSQDPRFWALASVFTGGEDDNSSHSHSQAQNPPAFQFEFVSHPEKSSGTVEIPLFELDKSVNLTLFTFTFSLSPKKPGQFNGRLLDIPQTFRILNSTMPQVSPGILPPSLQHMLDPGPSHNRTPVIVGAVLGSVVFLLFVSTLFVFYCRRRKARIRRETLEKDHALYRSRGFLTKFPASNKRRGSEYSSKAWSSPAPPYSTISSALSWKAGSSAPTTATTSTTTWKLTDSMEKQRHPILFNQLPLPENITVPSASHPNRRLSVHSASQLGTTERRDIEQTIARLRNRMKQLDVFDQSDRNTVEGIEDEVTTIEIKLEVERLQRLLDGVATDRQLERNLTYVDPAYM
ncbi:hypothetical protein EV361DRAFT_966434 [Lentinula raphanica]|nr:hypothetical protein EV361DRAFT_966434 [Lentinula raphanica]